MRINDHQRENALIFYQILSTFSLRKCMGISLEKVNWLKLKGYAMASWSKLS